MKNTTTETLVLTKDVKNPKPDRRYKRDWRMVPVWEAGTKFVVTTELIERTHEIKNLAIWEGLHDKLVAAGEEVSEEVSVNLKAMRALVDSGPYKHIGITKRGTYDRVFSHMFPEVFDALMAALKPAEKDMKDVLGDYASDSYGGPIHVLQQLVDNGALTFRQIERAVAELDPDHTDWNCSRLRCSTDWRVSDG